MKNILAFLIVGLGFLCSCESRDGDWDSMVWVTTQHPYRKLLVNKA